MAEITTAPTWLHDWLDRLLENHFLANLVQKSVIFSMSRKKIKLPNVFGWKKSSILMTTFFLKSIENVMCVWQTNQAYHQLYSRCMNLTLAVFVNIEIQYFLIGSRTSCWERCEFRVNTTFFFRQFNQFDLRYTRRMSILFENAVHGYWKWEEKRTKTRFSDVTCAPLVIVEINAYVKFLNQFSSSMCSTERACW